MATGGVLSAAVGDSHARAEVLEPDITLAWRIVAKLSENAPAEDGWAAYVAAAATKWNRLGDEFDKLAPTQREVARALAHCRLGELEEALPAAQRPQPLPRAADVAALRERYAHLKTLLEETVPQLDRLLFTLPGAY
ncbi:hypothetical protein [Nocardia africana]